MKLQGKLQTVILLVAILPFVSISVMSVKVFDGTLKNVIMDKLISDLDNKKEFIESTILP